MCSLFVRRCETRFVSLDLASSDSLCGFSRSHTIRSLEAIPIVLPFVFQYILPNPSSIILLIQVLMLLINEKNLSSYISLF
ncbi:unnamed protein product [Brassica napus]|uniref:(rape) hypothetical protein n=1 Tax=Brassica napus TaxID=3708 RepID=A0A817BKN1_BRANA|nr:unnamed protein product [Brassica napus]